MRRPIVTVLLSLVVVLACVTINVYFPEEEIRDLSQQIEEEVRRRAAEEHQGEATEEPQTSRVGTTRGASPWALLAVVLPASALQAQQEVPAPEVTNPAIRKIIESRAERLTALNRLKSQGVVGENNRALVEIRDLQRLDDLRARAEAQRLVREENADRELLFKEIARAKGVDLEQLPLIHETYAETMRQYARPGDLIQLGDGTWTRAE